MVDLLDAAVGAGLVLGGFLLAVVWDRYKEKRQRDEERTRLAVAIRSELTENAGKATEMRDSLRESSKLGEFDLQPNLSALAGDSWRLALFNWSLLRMSEDLRSRTSELYGLGEHINAIIRIREGFLIQRNMGLVELHNLTLLGLLDDYLNRCKEVVPRIAAK